MTDNTKVNSYQDQLLDSFGIIAEQIISNLSFDKTIVCVIVDDSRSSFGEYVVKYDNATFKVYSNGIDTYILKVQ